MKIALTIALLLVASSCIHLGKERQNTMQNESPRDLDEDQLRIFVHELEKQQRGQVQLLMNQDKFNEQAAEIAQKYDENKDGLIQPKELGKLLRETIQDQDENMPELTQKDIAEIYNALDRNGDGQIDKQEAISGIRYLLTTRLLVIVGQKQYLRNFLGDVQFQINNHQELMDGEMEYYHLMEISHKLFMFIAESHLLQQEVSVLAQSLDNNQDDALNLKEFTAFMNKLNRIGNEQAPELTEDLVKQHIWSGVDTNHDGKVDQKELFLAIRTFVYPELVGDLVNITERMVDLEAAYQRYQMQEDKNEKQEQYDPWLDGYFQGWEDYKMIHEQDGEFDHHFDGEWDHHFDGEWDHHFDGEWDHHYDGEWDGEFKQ